MKYLWVNGINFLTCISECNGLWFYHNLDGRHRVEARWLLSGQGLKKVPDFLTVKNRFSTANSMH